MIVAFALMMTAIVNYSQTGLRATTAIREVRNVQHDVDGVMDGAINSIRGSQLAGTVAFGSACGPFGPVKGSDGQDDFDVTVTCTPQSTGASAFDDQPRYAIITLGTAANQGLFVNRNNGNGVLKVDGGVYSHKDIRLKTAAGNTKSQMIVLGDVFAEGVCDPIEDIRTLAGLKRCGSSDPSGDDPNYPSLLSAIPTPVDPPGICAGMSSDVVKFVPGYYSELPTATCSNRTVWWFSPGNYYFDFPDNAANWPLTKHTIIGGTPNGWNPATSTASQILDPATFYDNCLQTQPGVQFLFGGPTSMSATQPQDHLLLCASPPPGGVPTKQQIALYGQPTGTRTNVGPTDLKPQLATSTDFVPANAAKVVDNVPAVLALNGDTKTSGSIVLDAYDDIPEGSTLTKATIRVVHSETGGSPNKVTPSVTLDFGTGNKTYAVPNSGSFATDFKQDVTNDLPPNLRWRSVNNLKVTYNVTSSLNPTKKQGQNTTPAETAIESLDGIYLIVEYKSPGFEAVRCGNPSCLLFESKVDDRLFVKGTGYTPTADMKILVNNKRETIFSRGVIARTLDVDVSASSKQTTSPFSLPKATPNGRKVLFTAFVDGRAKLQALVEYVDFDIDPVTGETFAFPGRKVKILDWNVLR